MEITEEMIAKLPVWARNRIRQMDRLQRDVEVLKKQNRVLADRLECAVEIFTASAKGGNETAKAFVDRIIEEWQYEEEEDEERSQPQQN